MKGTPALGNSFSWLFPNALPGRYRIFANKDSTVPGEISLETDAMLALWIDTDVTPALKLTTVIQLSLSEDN